MWTVDELRGWLLPQNVLLDNERHREAELLELFREQLALKASGDRKPTPTQRIAARRRAVVLWEMDRATNDIQTAAIRRRQLETQAGRRQDLYAESELRNQTVALAIHEIDSWDRFVSVALGMVEAVAIPERSSG